MNKKLFSFIFTFVLIFIGLFAGSFINKVFAVAPTITSFYPTSGKVGDIITIYGENLSDINSVFFGSTPVADKYIKPVSITELNVVVPVGATDGLITVKTAKFGNAVTVGHTFKVITGNSIITNTVSNKTTLIAKDFTQSGVTLVATGILDKNSYDFYLYDSATYYNPPLQTFKAIASKTVDLENPTDGNITVRFDNLKLQQGESYFGLVSYNGDNNNYPFSKFQIPVDLDSVNVSNITTTTVELEATGMSPYNTYQFYVYNDPTKTPNTSYDIKKAFSPLVTEAPVEVLPSKISFTGLVAGNNYIAALIKNGEIVNRKPFVALSNPATPATPSTVQNNSSKIVPDCNTGEIDKVTGQYKNPCDFNYFMLLINNAIKFLLFTIATPLVALIIMYTAYLFLTAGGSAGQTEKAKHILWNVVIGYIVALAAWLVVNTIMTTLLDKNAGINTFLDKGTLQK